MNKLSNELKIGLIVLVAILIAFFGFRVMRDQPVFRSANMLYVKYDAVDGLLKGGLVSLKGIKVGTIREIRFLPEDDSVLVALSITEDILIPVGSEARIIAPLALGSSWIEIIRSSSTTQIQWDGYLQGASEEGLLDSITEKGGSIADSVSISINKVNSVLTNAEKLNIERINEAVSSFKDTGELIKMIIGDRQSEIDSMIIDARNTMMNLSEVSDTSKEDIQKLLSNLEKFSSELEIISIELKASSESMNSILAKIDLGEGSLGKMINDPSLYNNMDSLTVNLNELIKGIQSDPRRYLKHMRLVEIF